MSLADPPSSSQAPGDDPLIGTVVAGRYRILQRLGEGGMGTVYRALHEALRKPVAIKLLHQKARADAEMAARFEREAVAAANLKHPNIAEATDFGQLPDGTLFLVLEYVEGSSLRDVLRRDGRLPAARALAILEQIGAALALAHAHGVVHRDLKPENVIVFDRGAERDRVKVIDFGIARVKSSTFGGGHTRLTMTGAVFGTAEYMSPEQAMGQEVDARADQYALGVIAFELLTGKAPFSSDNLSTLLLQHVGAPIPQVSASAPGAPRGLDPVVERMMGKLPEERYASVAEAMSRLAEAVLTADPVAPVHSTPSPAAPLSSAAAVSARSLPQITVRMQAPPVSVAQPPPSLPVSAAKRAATGEVDLAALLAARWPILVVAGASLFTLVVVIALITGVSRSSGSAQATRPEVTAALGDWSRGRYAESFPALMAALEAYPEAADDAVLARTLAGSLRDREARSKLASLLGATALGRSSVMMAALAEQGMRAQSDERDAILGLMRGRTHLLGPEPRARVELRDAETCEALDYTTSALAALGEGPARDDLDALADDCRRLLRQQKVCECQGGHGSKKKGKKK